MTNIEPTPAPADVIDDPKRPWKAIVAVVLAVAIVAVQAIQTALNDQVWNTEDTMVVILAVLGALSVYLVPNPKVLR